MKANRLFLALIFYTITLNISANDNSYTDGENLKYLVYYGWIDGGTASLSINKIKNNGIDIYHATAFIETIGLASTFVPLEDKYDSFFDINTGKPIKAIRDVKEGDYENYNEVTFDHSQNIVNSQKKGEVKVPNNIFDIVSGFYHARKSLFDNLHKNDTVHLTTYFTDEVYPLDIVFKGVETIKTKAGKFEALKFMPVCEVGRVFEDEDDMTIYISNDKNKIPLRMEFDMLIGSLKCDLIEYKGIVHKLSKK